VSARRVRGARDTPHGPKAPFDAHEAVRRLREAVRDLADAAMFELRERGWGSLFHQLVACILSIRTRDEVSLPTALSLFDAAPTPAELAALSEGKIDRLIGAVTFHERKAGQIRAIARSTVEDHGGELPCDVEVLTAFSGVGPKCANLALGVACGAERISVDVHVWRVTNRWGIIAARTPEQAIPQLEAVLPREYWIEINRLLVPFGKHVCTGTRPKCSACPLLEMCEQVGVSDER
jgi:endonuclease-3